MTKRHICIISPASAKANNGNWQTAQRWQRFLRTEFHAGIAAQWDGAECAMLIALHARRSAAAIADYAAAHPARPILLVLTGTDLYRDIRTDAAAQRSMQLATHIVVLQAAGLQELPKAMQEKASVIYQSARTLRPVRQKPAARHFTVCMIGHLRDEKDPLTFMQAAALVTQSPLRLLHVGAALEDGLENAARQTEMNTPRYRWLGPLPHARARQLLRRSQLMVLTSKMEGGANVIIEAVSSGVPVLASDIAGNRGMLGDDYAGYFAVGDARQLAALIDRAASDPAFLAQLHTQCEARAALFAPERERSAVLGLARQLLDCPSELPGVDKNRRRQIDG